MLINPINLFKSMTKKRGQMVAMYSSKINISYSQLDELSDIFAGNLTLLGIKKCDRVAIQIERSVVFFGLIIALWKIGAHFITFDLTLSIEKTMDYFDESAAKLLIIDKTNVKYENTRIISIQKLKEPNEVVLPSIKFHRDTIAYVIYTSGSTGRPKAIPISFGNINNHLQKNNPYVKKMKNLNATCLTSISSINFDAIVWELLFFINGFQLYVFSNEQVNNIENIAEIIKAYNLSIAIITPSRLSTYLKSKKFRKSIKRMKYMNIGGEKPIIEDINTIHRISDALTVNAYGPTEATIVVGYKEIIGAKKYISIGKPFGDNQCFIVNDKNKIINEQYVDGELVLSGSQISRGYINNDEKSKQNFIHSFACHGRAYKTGDISCWDKNKEILIKGRKDFQIKINGQRTEPGAIESEIIKHPSIITARVFQFVHKKNTVLSCIYTTRKPIIEKDIQLFLKGKLSDYMIPHFFFNANKISLGSTEKFDFNEVKSMAIKSYVKTVGKNPNKLNANVRNNLDSILLNKLKEIVDIKQISIHTNFKSCGMDSLKYISLISILKEMGIKVEYEDIFKTNNVQELSDLISFRHPAVSLIGRFKHKSLLNKYVESYSMQNTRIEKVNKRQNVLITGGNGFLGTHLIYKLLKLKRNVYCPIRANNKSLAIRKLQDGMTQFSKNAIKQIMDLLDKRLFIIPITNYTEPFWGLSKKKYSDLQSAINIVVHCAANVNHFTVIDESMKSNVNVTTSIARFCSVKHIKLFHISTMSVSSVDFPNLNNNVNSLIKKFDERSLWINQPTSNTYVQSKLLAELQLINLSMNKIINLSIIRLGNLANNSVDGSFQTNYDKNAFALMIRSWILLKNIPNYLKNKLIDISPIDKTCDAIIKILDYDNHEFNIYHAYTSKLIRLDKLIYYLNKCGYRISFISSNKFKAVLQRNHKSRKWEQIFMGLFPFLTNNSIVKLNNDIDIRNEITTIFLNKCNFNWIDINLNYIKKYVKFFEKHYFFNVA